MTLKNLEIREAQDKIVAETESDVKQNISSDQQLSKERWRVKCGRTGEGMRKVTNHRP